jgi:hypothetical protein
MAWAPLNPGAKDPNDTYKEAIILLSDGLNTQDRWYADAAWIDTRQKMLCKNARDAGVTVYTTRSTPVNRRIRRRQCCRNVRAIVRISPC